MYDHHAQNHNNAYSLAASVPVSAAAATATSSSFLKYLLVFTAGGLFFSSAIALAYTFYGIGVENMRRILGVVVLVLQRVWISFTVGIGTARLALLGKDTADGEAQLDSSSSATEDTSRNSSVDLGASSLSRDQQGGPERHSKKSWYWRKAWNVLKEQLSETGRTAAEGVKALRKEQTLYSALVGQPGLVPIQYIITKLMPFSVSTILETSLRDALKNVKPTKAIKKMTLSSFNAGNTPPILEAARVYDVDNAIAFDYDVKWNSEIEATFRLYTAGGLARIPVSVKSIKFSGVVRVVLTPLLPDPPGYGAVLLSLPTSPQLSLDVKVLGGELTKVPFLKREITSMMQKSIRDQLLWPRRNVIPTLDRGRVILDRSHLAQLQVMDPLLQAEEALSNSTQPMMKDIRDRLVPKNDPSKRDWSISLLENNDESNITKSNMTEANGNSGSQNKSWLKWFNRGELAPKSLKTDSAINASLHSTTETNANQTILAGHASSIGAEISNVWENVCKFFHGDAKDQNPTLSSAG